MGFDKVVVALTSMSKMSVSLHVSERNSWRVLSLTGRVDAFSDKRIVSHLRQLAPEGIDQLALDLSSCEFLSLWALMEIGHWARELKEQGRDFAILSPSDGVLKQLNVFVGNRVRVTKNLDDLQVETFYRHERAQGPAISLRSP